MKYVSEQIALMSREIWISNPKYRISSDKVTKFLRHRMIINNKGE